MRLPILSACVALGCLLPAQNSTRKIRTAPGELAAKVGSAVAWRDDLAAALAEAAAGNKLVFWYVPSVARSPMDRKPEIDRYMRGGPFSWPTTISLLQSHFVAVDEVPAGELQQRYDLVRQRFIEPGYLVLDAGGKVLLKVDQITTLHPQWFEAPLRRLVNSPLDGFPGAPALREAWDAYRDGDREALHGFVGDGLLGDASDAVQAEAYWLSGAMAFRDNRPEAAQEIWAGLAKDFPNEPLAWKAALELEGHGPFVHGFEDYLPLPAAVLSADPVDGSRAPGIYTENELWQRSVRFLLAMDDGTGVVRDSIYDFGGTDGLPNVYAAVTCLVGMALLAADARAERGELELEPALRTRLNAMLEQLRSNAAEEGWLALSDRDEIVWARAYAVRFLAAWARLRQADAAELLPLLSRGAGALLALQPETGAWFHEYGNPFATATALQALHDARTIGCEVDDEKIRRGLAALASNRTDEGAFTYGQTRSGKPRATLEAAAGRMPLCELALFLFGKSDRERLAAAVATGQRHHGLLAAVRKYDDHADRHGYGGFFFWFDMLGRAEAAARLAPGESRAATFAAMRQLVLDLPEYDGCFVDSHELGRAYGTAMALLVLDVLEPR